MLNIYVSTSPPPPPGDLWSYVDPMWLPCRSCDSHVDPMPLTSHSRFTLEALMSLLCHSAKIATLEKFQEWLATDLRPCRVTYESSSDIRPICEGLATDIRASPALPTRKKFPDRFEPLHTVGELVPSNGESPPPPPGGGGGGRNAEWRVEDGIWGGGGGGWRLISTKRDSIC